MFRLEAKIIAREGHGRSVIAAAAYRAGLRLKDEIKQKIFDYTQRQKGVIETAILVPPDAPTWANDPARLWNMVEICEKRKDSQLSREFILAVPPELTAEQQFQAATAWAQKELVEAGMIAQVSLHHTKSGNNPHVHILCTMRKLDGESFAAKKATEWNDVELLVKQRASWADFANAALEKAGRSERIDHRSLKDRGIDRIPEPKIGVAATAMKRRGVVADPERFKLVRWVKLLNEVRPWARAVEKFGEIYSQGMGKTWWERSLHLAVKTPTVVRDTVRETFEAFVNAQRASAQTQIQPELSRDNGPDMER